MARRTFPENAELVLLACLGLAFLMIIQAFSKSLYQLGLALLIVSTLLEIAVGNIPNRASFKGVIGYATLYLGIIAAVFALGIVLVPYLTGLGR